MPLAPYHLSVKTVSRGKGRSATAACAYRSGARIEDQRTGQVFDYSRRGGVDRPACEIFAPDGAPEWARERQALWNAAEASESRINSVVAREFEIGLPADLDDRERRALVQQFANALVERHGVVVDASIHAPDHEAQDGRGNRNHHAHVLCTTRRVGEQGFGEKTRELDNQRSGAVEEWRAAYAAMCGDALERAGFGLQAARWRAGHLNMAGQMEAARERGDDAFVAENQDRVATKHYGPNVIQIEQKGIVTERGEKARVPERLNAQVIDMAEARKRLAAERTDGEAKAPRSGLFEAAREARTPAMPRLLDVPLPSAPRPADIVLREWRAETERQFQGVQSKAERVDGYARGLLTRHERRQEEHRQRKPVEPRGLIAAVKRGSYEIAAKAWERTRAAIQKRIERLSGQIDRLAGYMRRAFPHEAQPSPGERLAEKKAEVAKPVLAAEARDVIERQQQEARQIAQQAAHHRHHHHHHQEGQTMADSTIGASNAAEVRQRREAEERARLERGGRLAGALSDSIDAPSAAPKLDGREITDRMAGKPDTERTAMKTDQERKVEEARERIRTQRENEREKARGDRDQDKGRGRGR